MDLSGKFDSITVSKNKKIEGSYEFSLNAKSDTGTVKDINMEFYCGNKLYNQIKKLGFGLETTVDFGAFKELSKFFLYLLNFFHKISNNYGIAIILLSILLQIVTYPLTLKSFQSARAMKHLQPKIQELQLKYKSDPKRMQAETMHLYKTQKVNPFGGCLPMILQIPIFWALFSALQSAYELRNANFVFWINDLSNSDPLLPILMGVSMFVQQKMTAISGDQTQKMMLYMMPVMFTVIFWNFPSGLVLYWLTNNILSIIIQYIVLKRDSVKVS